jgi:hypothetical protein
MVQMFESGRTLMDPDEQSGRPSTSRSEHLIAQVKNTHWLTAKEFAEED